MGDDLGREFVASGRITEEQLATATEMQSETGGDLLRILVKLGFIEEQDRLESIAKREGLEVAKPEELKPDAEVIAKLPRELLEKNDFLPISHSASHLRLALADPGNLPAVEEVRFRSSLEVDIVLASSKDIQRLLASHYGAAANAARGGVRRSRNRMAAQKAEIMPAAADAARAVAEIDASPAKLMRGIAALLIEKRVISATELKEWVHRLE